jgi:hypothetical protein
MPAELPFRSTASAFVSRRRATAAAISCIKITSPGYTGTLGNIDLKGHGRQEQGRR